MYGNFLRSSSSRSSRNRGGTNPLEFEMLEPRHLLTVIIDNGDAGYSNLGTWATKVNSGYQEDVDWSDPGEGDTASWTFSVNPGATYQVSATWFDHPTAASNSPFTIYDGATQVSTVIVNQQVAPVQFSDAGAVWDDLVSSLTVANNTLTVELSDLSNGRAIADAIRVEEIVLAPDIEVFDGAILVPDDTGSVSFGSTTTGTNVSKIFTINNVGSQDLTLDEPISLPTGFSLVSSFGTTTLTPGSSTTFEVELDASTTGSFSGELSFDNNDPDEDPFNFSIDGTVSNSIPIIIDNGDAGYSSTAAWNNNFNAGWGYQDDFQWVDAGSGAENASWTFNVNPGSTYRVSATWYDHSTAATNAPFTIFDGATQIGTAKYNQRTAPILFSDQGATWNDLMSSVTVANNTLTVQLSDLGKGRAIADAIRIEEIIILPGPEIEVLDSATDGLLATSIPDGIGTVSFGSTILGHNTPKTFTVKNLGDQNLTLNTPITVPTGFSLVRSFGNTNLLPGESTTFVVELDASSDGTFTGEVSFGSNDADESTFNFDVNGGVVLLPADITDNVDPAFIAVGSWNSNSTFGYQNSINWTDPGDGDTASWTFEVVPGSSYQVSATWFHHPTAATDAPYTIYDGAAPITTVNVNQQVAPVQFSESGAMWDDLTSSITIASDTLTVELSDLADGRVVADAIRIQRVTPSAGVTYIDVAAEVGMVLGHELAAICDPPLSPGSAWGDFNNDGLIDFITTNQGGANHLYRNDGDTSGDGLPDFTDVAVTAGVDAPAAASVSAVFIDYDNDGDQDLYISNWGGNTLYQNQLIESGSAVFTDVTSFAGLADGGRAITTAWGDYDQDGNLDVYLAKHMYCGGDPQSEDHLYRGNGDGTFTDVSSYLGTAQLNGLGFAPGWVDFDNDSDLDLYLVNDDINGVNYPNVLWRNDGSDGLGGWIFTDISVASGTNISLNGMGLGIGDYDNNGLMDFAFSNGGPNYLLQNQGDGTFDDVSAFAGIEREQIPTGTANSVTWGTAFFDHDNDSWLDLMFVAGNIADIPILQPNAFFSNNADGTFTDISDRSGLDGPGRGRAASMVDFDQDGFVDIFVGNYGQAPRLYHNQSADQGNTNNWLTVTVEGTVSNRDGIGTRLTLSTTNGITQMRDITSGPTHGGGDYRAAYFGLSDQASGDLTVRWPNGVVENMGTVTAGQHLHLIEPTPRGAVSNPPPGDIFQDNSSQGIVDSAFAGFDDRFSFELNKQTIGPSWINVANGGSLHGINDLTHQGQPSAGQNSTSTRTMVTLELPETRNAFGGETKPIEAELDNPFLEDELSGELPEG